MVVEADSALKFICCKGECRGCPSNALNKHMLYGHQQLLYNTSSYPFDVHPLN